MTTIAPLPPAPLPSDDEFTLNDKMFATFGAFPDFIDQTNAVGVEANLAAAAAGLSQGQAAQSESGAQAAAQSAHISAIAAASSAGAQRWISGKLYEDGEVVWGPAKGRIYRRLGDGSGVLDPSADEDHWLLLSPIGDPTALAITYDGQGRPQRIDETVGANLRQTTPTYNADGTVATVEIVIGGVTRTETYSYAGGILTGMTATEV